jgi:hypothetical protein
MGDLLAVIAQEIAQQLDFTRAERINRSFVPDSLHKQEADLIYRVPFHEGTREVWIYLLLEHQSRPDRAMGLRLLSYMVQLWETQRRHWEDAKIPARRRRLAPVLPIVFYTGKRKWRSAMSLIPLMDVPDQLSSFVPRFETLFLELHAMPPERLHGSAIAQVLKVLQAVDAPLTGLEAALREAVSALERLPETAQAEWRKAMHYLLLLIRHNRVAADRTGLYGIVIESVDRKRTEEVVTMARTDAEVLVAKGEARGQLQGARAILLHMGTRRLGPPDDRVLAAIDALKSVAQLKRLTDRIMESESWDSLFTQ